MISGFKSDTFQYSPNLAYMYFYTNGMTYTGQGLISHLKDFKDVGLQAAKTNKLTVLTKAKFYSFHGCNDELKSKIQKFSWWVVID